MKKLFFVMAAVACIALNSCSKDNVTNPQPDNPDNPSLKDELSTVNVKDARFIYMTGPGESDGKLKSQSNLRSNTLKYTCWKLDKDGKASELLAFNKNGKDSKFKINFVIKGSDNILLANAYSKDEGNEPLMIDLKTEKIFLIPGDQYKEIFSSEGIDNEIYTNTFTDKDGMIYFNAGETVFDHIYKIDPVNHTIQQLLNSKIKADVWDVNKNGFISCQNPEPPSYFFLLTPGLKMIPLNNSYRPFLFNDCFYHIQADQNPIWQQGNPIALWQDKEKGTNDIEQIKICDLPKDFVIGGWWDSYRNPYRNSYFWLSNSSYEFDGKKLTKIPVKKDDENFFNGYPSKSALTYISQDKKNMFTIQYADYSTDQLPIQDANKYDFAEFHSDSETDIISFTGVRYSDQKGVIGHIDLSGKLTIDKVDDSGNVITNLIEIK